MRPVAAGVLAAIALTGCGTSTASPAPPDPRGAVTRYFAALGRGDARAACAQLTAGSQSQLAQFGHLRLNVEAIDCAATIQALLDSPYGAALKTRSAAAKITGVTVTGRHALVRTTGADAPLRLERDGRTWRISSSPTGEPD